MNYYFVAKAKKSRIKFFEVEPAKLRAKFMLDSSLNVVDRMLVYIRYMKRRKLSYSVSYIHTRCLINYRAHSVFRRFRMSRIQMKNYAAMGYIAGVSKSSW